ncbi:hypothetical protein [Paraburkholderia caffeinilytica]|nr:hypothetical protein [Paraburkholderia caffeinilytica]CAB3777656.1 hypothetical protein LMG28690_00495 [Paraburkholderia caffeinilytica]
MTKSVQASHTRKPRGTYTLKELDVRRVAKEAAALIARHQAQFANLAALARTIQTYMPTGKKHQSDYGLLASALADSAENYRA